VVRRLGIHASQLARLREWKHLRYAVVPSQVRTMGQYDAEQIDVITRVLRDASPIETAASKLGLPVYATEQLVFAGLLNHEEHEAALVIGRDRTVRNASLRRLLADISAAMTRTDAPTSAIPLRVAARRFGGGAKPWGAMIVGVLAGYLTLWSPDDTGDLLTALVDGQELAAVVASTRPHPPFGSLQPSTSMSQRDAAEMLNSDWKTFTRLAGEVCLPTVRNGCCLAVDRATVEKLATSFSSALEVQLHVGGTVQEIRRIVADLRITPIGPGWNRAELRRAGLLPSCWMKNRPDKDDGAASAFQTDQT